MIVLGKSMEEEIVVLRSRHSYLRVQETHAHACSMTFIRLIYLTPKDRCVPILLFVAYALGAAYSDWAMSYEWSQDPQAFSRSCVLPPFYLSWH